MKLLDTLEIRRSHIGHGHKVTIEEGQAVIIIFYRQAVPHIRSNHIDKAKIAVVGTFADAVKYCRLEFHAQFFIKILIKGNDFPFTINMLYRQVDFFISHGKTYINDIPQGLLVDGDDFITGNQLQFLGQTPLIYSRYYPSVFFATKSWRFIA